MARQASDTAPPDITMQREPQVPVEYGVSAVSPWIRRTSAGSMPSSVWATCASVVSSPCPCECVPIETVTAPVWSNLISALSGIGAGAGPAEISMALAMPMPRSLPRVFASLRRPAKPVQSASSSASSMLRSNSPES